jgi:hypothetical protein
MHVVVNLHESWTYFLTKHFCKYSLASSIYHFIIANIFII